MTIIAILYSCPFAWLVGYVGCIRDSPMRFFSLDFACLFAVSMWSTMVFDVCCRFVSTTIRCAIRLGGLASCLLCMLGFSEQNVNGLMSVCCSDGLRGVCGVDRRYEK